MVTTEKGKTEALEVELRQQREDNLRQREDILALRSAFEEEKGKAVQLRSNSEG